MPLLATTYDHDLQVGSAFAIDSDCLQPDITLNIELISHLTVPARVEAVSREQLVLSFDQRTATCRPWQYEDEPIPKIEGPVSAWIITELLQAEIYHQKV